MKISSITKCVIKYSQLQNAESYLVTSGQKCELAASPSFPSAPLPQGYHPQKIFEKGKFYTVRTSTRSTPLCTSIFERNNWEPAPLVYTKCLQLT